VDRLALKEGAPTLEGHFRFPDIKSITLNNVPIKVFDMFLGWLRCEMLECRQDPNDHWAEIDCQVDRAGDCYFDCDDPIMWDECSKPILGYAAAAIELFVFATVYGIPRLRQDALDRLVWCHNRWLEEDESGETVDYLRKETLQKAIEHTEPGDPLRAFLFEEYRIWGDKVEQALMELPVWRKLVEEWIVNGL
jgi:hypothetical protein